MRTGVILLNMGGPSSSAEIRPFLTRIFSDREIIRLPGGRVGQPVLARLISSLRQKKVRANYDLIGGGSPLLRHTKAQARGLATRLRERGIDALVAPAMRYTNPSAETTLHALRARGIERLVAVSLYPQYSQATTGSSLRDLERARDKVRDPVPFRAVDRFGDHSGYLDALAARAGEGLHTYPVPDRGKVVVLFSAHSLPQKFIDDGDPYVDEIRRTVKGVLDRLPPGQAWRLAFQSQTGPVKWVGPTVEEALSELAGEGVADVLAVPVAFVSDHIETLYETDILHADAARELGITLRRAESLNASPLFLDALADIVEGALS